MGHGQQIKYENVQPGSWYDHADFHRADASLHDSFLPRQVKTC